MVEAKKAFRAGAEVLAGLTIFEELSSLRSPPRL